MTKLRDKLRGVRWLRKTSKAAPIKESVAAKAKTKGRISIPRHEAAAVASRGEVHRSGESTPEATKSLLEKLITRFVRGMEYQRCEIIPTIDPTSVPSATPIPPKSEPSTTLATKLLRPSESGLTLM